MQFEHNEFNCLQSWLSYKLTTLPSQTATGNAFEYAVALALRTAIGESLILEQNGKLSTAERAFRDMPALVKDQNLSAATAGVELLLNLEPMLLVARRDGSAVVVTLQSDQLGALGDVRDVVIRAGNPAREIGISAKHQSEDLKHSRLSQTIDFGNKWFGLPCSKEYFSNVQPVFEMLSSRRTEGVNWSDLPNKEGAVYVPVLSAFRNELLQLDRDNPGVVPATLIRYLVGREDFYKIMKLTRQTKVQVFNFNGNLGRSVGAIRAGVKLEKPNLPHRVIHVDFANKKYMDTLELIFDAGWQLSLRVHSARTKVEPSLKFAVGLIGHPRELQAFSLIWPASSDTDVTAGLAADGDDECEDD
jgi:hypothetical protein